MRVSSLSLPQPASFQPVLVFPLLLVRGVLPVALEQSASPDLPAAEDVPVREHCNHPADFVLAGYTYYCRNHTEACIVYMTVRVERFRIATGNHTAAALVGSIRNQRFVASDNLDTAADNSDSHMVPDRFVRKVSVAEHPLPFVVLALLRLPQPL